jgi:hypothetical protein
MPCNWNPETGQVGTLLERYTREVLEQEKYELHKDELKENTDE